MEFEGQYLTYDEYLGLNGSPIGKLPFNLLEFEIRKNIDKYTFGRLKDLEEQIEEVKLCEYKLMTEISKYSNNDENNENKNISSETTDGYSITYNTISLADIKDIINSKEAEIKNIINTYLGDCKLEDGTPYLYRGVK